MDTLYYRKIAQIAHRDGDEVIRGVAVRVEETGRLTGDQVQPTDKRALRLWMREWCARKREIARETA